MSLATLYGETQEVYLQLIHTFPLRPLRSEDDLEEATAMLDVLVVQETLTTAEADYLAVLSELVEQYEADMHPIPAATDADVLQHLVEATGSPLSHVAQSTGLAVETLEAVLAGTQSLTREQIARIAHCFHVSPNVFAFGA